MFLPPGLELDPALIAFVKCHVTSPAKWEVLRVMAGREGTWLQSAQVARASHRPPPEVGAALAELASDGVLEACPAAAPEDVSYRLPVDEPTSVVLHRLIEAATHSQELREIIAAHFQNVRQRAIKSSAAA